MAQVNSWSLCAQVMRYAEQRIPTLSEYCVVCDERHVFQNGPMLKVLSLLLLFVVYHQCGDCEDYIICVFQPAVCTRELCVFSFYTLGVMSGATEEVATGAEVVNTHMHTGIYSVSHI